MAEPGQQLFRAFHDVLRLPAGPGAEVVHEPLTRGTHVLPAARARVLFACRGLATIEQHAARLTAELGGDVARHRADLAELLRVGLLVPAGELVRRLQKATAAEPFARITSIGVPTRGRALDLREALDTYVDDALRHERVLDYVVADGAPTEEEAAPTRAVIAEVAGRRQVSIAYAGPAEKARYAVALAARAGVAPEIVTFALLGDPRLPIATGANRNALLLHAAGDLSLQVDDDTRCRLSRAADPLPGLAVTSADDPTELWPLPAESALPGGSAAGAFVTLHEELLGRAVGDCVARTPGGLELGGATANLFRRVDGRGGRVVATQSGSAGDAATGSMGHVLRLEERSRERVLADEATYRRTLESRRVIRVAPRAAVGDGATCITMGLGLDGRALLPPFVPVQRNAGGVFAAVLRRCCDDALFGFVPWAVEHVPPEVRATSADGLWASVGRLHGNDLLRLLVAWARVEPDRWSIADPEALQRGRSLRALGDVLVRWGTLPLADFDELVRVQVLRARTVDLLLFEEALRRHGRAPAFWARDVDRAIALLREGVPRPESAWPADYTEALGAEEGRACFQGVVRRYGELLRVWPDLWEAALALRGEGVAVNASSAPTAARAPTPPPG